MNNYIYISIFFATLINTFLINVYFREEYLPTVEKYLILDNRDNSYLNRVYMHAHICNNMSFTESIKT